MPQYDCFVAIVKFKLLLSANFQASPTSARRCGGFAISIALTAPTEQSSAVEEGYGKKESLTGKHA